MDLTTKTEYNWCFYFLENEYNGIFVKNYIGPSNIDLSHKKTHNLSLNRVEFLIEKYKVKKQSKN